MDGSRLNPKAYGVAAALVALILDIIGYIWHGLLQQPSLVNTLYPGFWSTPSLLAIGLVSTLIGAFILGYLFAWLYNWANKKQK